MQYDVAVAGLGGIGSAILADCAARGSRAIGLEQFARGDALGSSSGRSRLIRKAYFEDAAYVPLLLRAYDLWRELERETDSPILQTIGLLLVGEENGQVVRGSLGAARQHGLRVESLGQNEILSRYPMLKLDEGEIGVFEPDGGVLNPERAVAAQIALAERRGAEVRFGSALKSWRADGDGFAIQTADQTIILARRLILALGPWFKVTLDSLGVSIRVQRNVQVWFAPRTDAYAAGRFPAFLLERKTLPAPLYGFPDFGDGLKAAFHGFGELTEADHVDREIDLARDVAPLARSLENWMPGASGEVSDAKACLYSRTPDEHFVIDRHPAFPNLVLCGGFSGHGFKFAPVVGEIAAELALDGGTRHQIDFLSLKRFLGDR